jgi:hypothetical protein
MSHEVSLQVAVLAGRGSPLRLAIIIPTMRFVRAPRLRTLLTALVVASMSLSIGELMVADVHDGDASEAELASISQLDAEPPAASPVATEPQGSSDSSQPEHTSHVCHCTHAHGGLATASISAPTRSAIAFESGFRAVQAPKTTSLAGPPTPPPIA